MKTLNKIFIVLSLSILLFTTTVFATEEFESVITTTLPSINDIVSENDIWLIYYSPSINIYSLIVYDGDISYVGNYRATKYNNQNPHIIEAYEYSSASEFRFYFCCGLNYKRYELINDNWTLNTSSTVEAYSLSFNYDIITYLCASNIDIYNNEQVLGNNDLVFQKSPILSTLTGINFRPMLWETMKETILGFLKYLIVFLISLTALYKGWQFLSTLLRGC